MERKPCCVLTTSPVLVLKKKKYDQTLEKPSIGEVALSEVMGHEQGHISQWWGSEKVRTGNGRVIVARM